MSYEQAFILDERLAKDSVFVAYLGPDQVRISKDARYPWLLLIPSVADVHELFELGLNKQVELLKSSNLISAVMRELFKPHKLNIACIGNIVKQLHIHHVARFEYDEVWPAPIWGRGEASAYTTTELNDTIERLRAAITTINNGEIDVNYHDQ